MKLTFKKHLIHFARLGIFEQEADALKIRIWEYIKQLEGPNIHKEGALSKRDVLQWEKKREELTKKLPLGVLAVSQFSAEHLILEQETGALFLGKQTISRQ